MRSGVRIAVDVGSVRVGVAASDPSGVLASPVTVLARDRKADGDVRQIAAIVAEREAIEVLVGWPRSLSGAEGRAAQIARDYAGRVAAAVAPVPVRLVDERLSTVEAAGRLRSSGRDARAARPVIDAQAAVIVLESALEGERHGGQPAGEPIPASTSSPAR